jgi:hypothetical protein
MPGIHSKHGNGTNGNHIMDVVAFWKTLNTLGDEFEKLHASHEQLLTLLEGNENRWKAKSSAKSESNGLTTSYPMLQIQSPSPPTLPANPSTQRPDSYALKQKQNPPTPLEEAEVVAWPVIVGRSSLRGQDQISLGRTGSSLSTQSEILRRQRSSRSSKTHGTFSGNRSGNTSADTRGPRGESLDLHDQRAKRELIAIFQHLDTDGCGALEVGDLRRALVAAGIPPARLQRVFQLADSDNSGSIELDEWVAAVMTPEDPEMSRLAACLR